MDEIFLALIAFGLVATPAVAACGLWWLIWGPATFRLLPIQRQRKSWWTGGEVVLAFFLFEVAAAMSAAVMDGIGFFDRFYTDQERQKRAFLWVGLLSTPVFLAAVLTSLFSLSKTRPSHLGITGARWAQNVVLGVLAFLAATPLIFALNYLVGILIPAEKHPLEQMLDDRIRLVEWGLIIFAAVVAAPILEEMLFRGILFRWLVRASWSGHVTVAAVAAAIALSPTLTEWTKHEHVFLGPALWVAFLIPFHLAAVFLMDQKRMVSFPKPTWAAHSQPSSDEIDDESNDSVDRDSDDAVVPPMAWQSHNPVAAIIGSSILFAAFHSNVWPSPMPLFILAVPLAWLAYRTQSLVAPIVFHALFNGVSVVIMALSAMLR